MKCKFCGGQIHPVRVELDLDYCVECANKLGSKRKGYMVYSHKTAPELILIDESDTEAIRQADRANKRSR